MPLITGDEVVFPNNVVNMIFTRFEQLWVTPEPDESQQTRLLKRPLKDTDNSESIGIYPGLWTPDENSYEIAGTVPGIPTIQRYLIMMQGFIKDSDRERGIAKHSVLAMRLRNVLYKDPVLRLALASGVQITEFGVTESLKRWGVQTQRYFSNEIPAGTWVFLSTLEYWIETETT